MDSKMHVTASEIGEFVYCKRAWFLRQKGLLGTTDAMRQGSIKHSRIGQLLWWHKILLLIAIILIGIGIIGIVIYFSLQLFQI